LRSWVPLHGYLTLRASVTEFPWPEHDELLDALITRLALIAGAPQGA
jgi:hypothetical protein